MHRFGHFESLLQEHFGVHQGSLVPYELFAPFVVLRKLALHERLEALVVSQVDRVPELGLAVMQVVDAVEVHIFFVPAEHGLPGANVDVRLSYAENVLATHALREQGVELTQVPRDILVEEAAGHVGAIQRSVVDERLPEELLYLFDRFAVGYPLAPLCLVFKALEGTRDHLDERQLVDSARARALHVLLDGPLDMKLQILIAGFARHPILRWNNLNDKKVRNKKHAQATTHLENTRRTNLFDALLDVAREVNEFLGRRVELGTVGNAVYLRWVRLKCTSRQTIYVARITPSVHALRSLLARRLLLRCHNGSLALASLARRCALRNLFDSLHRLLILLRHHLLIGCRWLWLRLVDSFDRDAGVGSEDHLGGYPRARPLRLSAIDELTRFCFEEIFVTFLVIRWHQAQLLNGLSA